MESKLNEMKAKVTVLERLLPQLKKGKLSDDPKMPRTTEQCLAAIEREKKKVEAEEYKLEDKKESKNLSLGTSKINYMDPRISISWCKINEVPIEKVFQRTLRSKFAWAMDSDPNWKF